MILGRRFPTEWMNDSESGGQDFRVKIISSHRTPIVTNKESEYYLQLMETGKIFRQLNWSICKHEPLVYTKFLQYWYKAAYKDGPWVPISALATSTG